MQNASSEPSVVADYLSSLLRSQWHPAFLEVTKEGTVLTAGGALALYGLFGDPVGATVVELLPLLFGLLPLPPDAPPFLLPWVNSDCGGYMDVHLLSGPATDYVVLVEAVVDRSERVTMQQQGNQLALDQHRQGRLLDSHVGRYVAEQLRAGGFSLREEGERREASLLFCDLRGFTSFAEQQPPELVFRTLNQLLQAMVQPILDRGGWLDKIAGDAVYAAFGLIPPPSQAAALPPPVQALLAGQEILHNLRRVNAERQRDGLLPLGAGIGISTGGVAVGILGTQERRQFSVIGHHVNLAARLQAQAQAGEIVIDAPTHAAIGALGDSFVPRPLRLKGLAELLPAYSLLSDS